MKPPKCWFIACDREAHPKHTPCCSSHGKPLCCRCYCRTHFVEVHQCSPETHKEADHAR